MKKQQHFAFNRSFLSSLVTLAPFQSLRPKPFLCINSKNTACRTHFHRKSFALRLISLYLRNRATAVVSGLPPTNVAWVQLRINVRCRLSLLLVLILLREFFSGFYSLPPSTKTNTPKSNSARIKDQQENQLRLMQGCQNKPATGAFHRLF